MFFSILPNFIGTNNMDKGFGRWKVSFFLAWLTFLQSSLSSFAILLLSGRTSKAIFDMSISFIFFFFAKIASASLWFRNLTIVRSILPSLWHATISFLSIFTPISLNLYSDWKNQVHFNKPKILLLNFYDVYGVNLWEKISPKVQLIRAE